MLKSQRSISGHRKTIIILLAILLIGGVVILLLERTETTSFFSSNEPTTEEDVKTTSEMKSAQSDYNDGEYRDPGNTLNEQEGDAIVSDNNGQIEDGVDTTNGVTSTSGEITVFSPVSNSVVVNGTTVAGSSTLDTINYRVIDNSTGVIATGELKVVNGKFSGKLSFNTGATEGRLDFFSTRSDGREFSNVEIPIRFK